MKEYCNAGGAVREELQLVSMLGKEALQLGRSVGGRGGRPKGGGAGRHLRTSRRDESASGRSSEECRTPGQENRPW